MAKNLPSAQLCWAISLQLRHVSTIRKKDLLNSTISSTCPHNMVNFSPLTAKTGWRVWGTPANFNGFPILDSLLQRRRSPEDNQTLHHVWPSPGLVRYIYIFHDSCPVNSLKSPSLAFYIGSVTVQHSSSGREPNFARSAGGITYIFGRVAITLGIGPHSG